ncbi:substrate-binding domain-containing protein [Bauldia sp.]|uniref:substrate-binding domain-containing protein n=1 Tax=Bauldia sp. TaxID=2575872 RepID=UPI003BAD2F72
MHLRIPFPRRLLGVLSSILLAVAGVGHANADDRTIGLAVANLEADFFNQIKQSVEAYGAEKGLTVVTVDPGGDSAKQASQVRDLLAEGIDALIYIPAEAEGAALPTRLARAQGVPVVNIDRNPPDEPGDTFIASDSDAAAYEVCKYLFALAGDAGELIILRGQVGTTPEVDRTEGCNRAMAGVPGVMLVGDRSSQIWSQDEGFQMAQELLAAHPDVTMIFGQSDTLAEGATRAVAAANLPQRVYIAGFDGDPAALEAIKDGTLDVTATQKTRAMGRLAVDMALELMAGQEVPPVQLEDAVLTTRENVQQFIDEHP